MPDVTEIKGTLDELGEAFEQFKKYNDEALQQKADKGSVDAVLKDALEKTNEKITELEEKKDKIEKQVTGLEAALARKGGDGESSKVDALDHKQRRHIAQFATLTKRKRFSPEDVTDETLDEVKQYKNAFLAYCAAGESGLEPDQVKALSVGSDREGGYFVDPDTTGRMVQRIFETSPVRQFASIETIGTDRIEGALDLDELDAGWVGEKQKRTVTGHPNIGEWEIPVHELYAMPRVTQKQLDDSTVDMESWLATKTADKFARVENDAFVNGDGIKKPRGFLTYPAGTKWRQIEQIKSGAVGGFPTVEGADNPDALIDATNKLKPQYRDGANWFMNRFTHGEVRKLKDSDGNYLLQPGLQLGAPSLLLGFSIAPFEDMPSVEADSLSIAFGNFTEAYTIVDRIGVRTLRDPYSEKGFVLFYSTRRTGGDVINFEAIKLIKFTD